MPSLAFFRPQSGMGIESPHTRASILEFAFVYHYQDRLDEAQPLYEEVLEHARRIDGPALPAALGAAGSLASLYRHRGLYDAAERLYQETLALCREHLPEDESAITTASNLGVLYHDDGAAAGGVAHAASSH